MTASGQAGRVTVYGPDMSRPPLCDDARAQMVVVRDASGDPTLLLVRLTGDTWGLTTPEDKDWSALLVRFGLLRPQPLASVIGGSH